MDTWSQTLLPAHFNVISTCWNETLSKAPIAERIRLVAFLIQLLPHFPKWSGKNGGDKSICHLLTLLTVLSWEVVAETLLEDDYEDGGDGPAAAHLVSCSIYNIGHTMTNDAVHVWPFFRGW